MKDFWHAAIGRKPCSKYYYSTQNLYVKRQIYFLAICGLLLTFGSLALALDGARQHATTRLADLTQTGHTGARAYHGSSSWCLARLWSFVQPIVDAPSNAHFYHSCILYRAGENTPFKVKVQHSRFDRKWILEEEGFPSSARREEWTCQTLLVDAGLPPEVKTFPFSHMLLMLRIPSVTIGRSIAPDRGDFTSWLVWTEKAKERIIRSSSVTSETNYWRS